MNIFSTLIPRSRPLAASALLSALAFTGQGILGAAESSAAAPVFTGPVTAGRLEVPPRREASGLAASRRSPEILWTHDDSGGAPVLHAVDKTGRKQGALHIRGVRNNDWEDLASFELDGTAWLLIADTGDNEAVRDTVLLHLLEEPAPDRLSPERELSIPPAYSLRVRYEDGRHDCESVAVDVAGKAIYLLTKRDRSPRLYRVPLGVARQAVVEAKFAGLVPDLAGNSDMDAIFKMLVGKKAAWPTGMDFAPDGRTAAILTYGGVNLFVRQPKQSWPEALGGTPSRLAFHGLKQAEGLCFSADGRSLFVVSEEVTTFVRYDREGPRPGITPSSAER